MAHTVTRIAVGPERPRGRKGREGSEGSKGRGRRVGSSLLPPRGRRVGRVEGVERVGSSLLPPGEEKGRGRKRGRGGGRKRVEEKGRVFPFASGRAKSAAQADGVEHGRVGTFLAAERGLDFCLWITTENEAFLVACHRVGNAGIGCHLPSPSGRSLLRDAGVIKDSDISVGSWG